jgi:soluble lytic murein transglycosylase
VGRQGEPAAAAARLADEAAPYPVLADYVLYFRARAARAAGRRDDALTLARTLLATQPDSVWTGRTALLAGALLGGTDPSAAAADLATARAALPHGSRRWARATLLLAELDHRAGDDAQALDLAREVRRGAPRTIAARRARRLSDRVVAAHPELAPDPVDEAETRLREGDTAGARAEAADALETERDPSRRARALWVRAQAEHALGMPAAEATCRTLAAEIPDDPLAPRALVAAGGWRWNADDDAGALRLFQDVVRRFPDSPQAADALYAIGRIAQEAGRYDEAARTYAHLAERFPTSELAPEAGWRAGWVRWLAGDVRAAERTFARVASDERDGVGAAAEYWRGRSLERLGRDDEARASFERVDEHHSTSYYAGLAEDRLGRRPPEGSPPEEERRPPFPDELEGPHAERARILDRLGHDRLARRELDALAATEAPRPLLDAYRAIGAVAPALRLATTLQPVSDPPGALGTELYPLGYWATIRSASNAHGVDPLLVAALIRQESFFDPDAVSGAGARGLMQLLPATARSLRPGGPLTLQDVPTNVDLGVELLARLVARYDGSLVKALAAYNGGEDAVAKWERRYDGRRPDEFVELISFRETRDYVKAVLRNYRMYRLVYAAPSPSTSSDGSPPKAPFDMTTSTSPGRALATR